MNSLFVAMISSFYPICHLWSSVVFLKKVKIEVKVHVGLGMEVNGNNFNAEIQK